MTRSSQVDIDEEPPSSAVNPSSSKMKAAQSRAEKAEAALRVVLDTSPVPIFIHRQNRIIYANAPLVRLLHYSSASELIGADAISALAHPDDAAAVREFQKTADGEESSRLRMRMRRRSGDFVLVEGARARIDFDGEPAVLVRARDMSDELRATAEREQSEHSLRVSEERYRVLFDRNPTPGYVFDLETLEILAANEAASRLYGYTHDEFLKLKLSDLRAPNAQETLRADVALIAGATDRSDPAFRATKNHCRKDGTPLQVAIVAHAINLDGRQAVLSMARDVTELERMERQLRQAQKMEAVGQLAGGIAHDFNNILAVILAVADMMLAEVGEEHAFTTDLREIESAARRAADLTHQLLTFSRQKPGQPKDLLLNNVVSEMRKMIARTVREDITTSVTLSAEGYVHADPAHLEQVLLNLVVNARDAMPDGGKIVIRTEDVDLVEASAQRLALPPGKYVQLSVTDSGTGMDASTVAHIFEPFFTTKEVGKGTGLGLATVFGIVKQADGAVWVQSTPGGGSAFHVLLPRVTTPFASDRASRADVDLPRGSEKILVVEDDESVRLVVSRVLRTNGYTVVEAGNGREALEVLDREQSIAVVLSDVVMPQMDGRTLGREIAVRFPHVKVLFMSGHDPGERKPAAPRFGESVLAKPFTLDQILQAVRRGIDSGDKTR